MASTASVVMPGTGMKDPSRYSASTPAVKSSFFRISATRNALKIVDSTALALDGLAGAARRLDALARRLGEAVRGDGERLGELAAAEDLDRDVALLRQPGGTQLLQADRGAGVEALIEVVQVHVLCVRPERLERHRHLLVRAAQLAHPHVDRVLAALEAGAPLGARARAVALVAAPGGLAVARAVPAPDALAVLLGPRGRLERMQPDGLRRELLVHRVLLAHSPSLRSSPVRASPGPRSTVTRWRTAWTMPRSCGESSRSTVLPMPRRPSERSVSRWRPLAPLDDLTCVMSRVTSSPPPAPPRSPRARRRRRRGPAPGRPRGRAAPRPPRAGAAPAGR